MILIQQTFLNVLQSGSLEIALPKDARLTRLEDFISRMGGILALVIVNAGMSYGTSDAEG